MISLSYYPAPARAIIVTRADSATQGVAGTARVRPDCHWQWLGIGSEPGAVLTNLTRRSSTWTWNSSRRRVKNHDMFFKHWQAWINDDDIPGFWSAVVPGPSISWQHWHSRFHRNFASDCEYSRFFTQAGMPHWHQKSSESRPFKPGIQLPASGTLALKNIHAPKMSKHCWPDLPQCQCRMPWWVQLEVGYFSSSLQAPEAIFTRAC